MQTRNAQSLYQGWSKGLGRARTIWLEDCGIQLEVFKKPIYGPLRLYATGYSSSNMPGRFWCRAAAAGMHSPYPQSCYH